LGTLGDAAIDVAHAVLSLDSDESSNVGLYVTGLTGPIGAAAAVGNLLKFDLPRSTSPPVLSVGAPPRCGRSNAT
jgi:hypothetical protein